MKKKESTRGILGDIGLALFTVMAGGAILAGIVYLIYTFTPLAHGAELKFIPDYPVAWIGAEYDFSNEPVTCSSDGYGWNGNVGIRQPLVDYSAVRMNGILQHHSCAFSSDNTDYNAVGINLEFHFGRLFNK